MSNQKLKMRNEQLVFIQKKRKSFNNTRIFGPFLLILINLLFAYSLDFEITAFLIILIFLTILTTIYATLLPQKAIAKLEKLVIGIEKRNGFIDFQCLSEKISIPKENIKIKNSSILVIDKEYIACLIGYNGRVLHIVPDFFDSEIDYFLENK